MECLDSFIFLLFFSLMYLISFLLSGNFFFFLVWTWTAHSVSWAISLISVYIFCLYLSCFESILHVHVLGWGDSTLGIPSLIRLFPSSPNFIQYLGFFGFNYLVLCARETEFFHMDTMQTWCWGKSYKDGNLLGIAPYFPSSKWVFIPSQICFCSLSNIFR